MKREADGDMGAPQKRTRRGDEEVRLLIPSKVRGTFFLWLIRVSLQNSLMTEGWVLRSD